MNTPNVIVRFMSLLDVALILIGVLIVILMQTAPRQPSAADAMVSQTSAGLQAAEQGGAASSASASIRDQIDFINLYAGWRDEQTGRCYVLNPDMSVGEEVSMNSTSDIGKLISRRGGAGPSIALLLFERQGWFPTWTGETIATLEKTWGIRVIPIYNATLPKTPESSR